MLTMCKQVYELTARTLNVRKSFYCLLVDKN